MVRQTTSSWQASQKGAPLPLATSSKMAETSWALGESFVMVPFSISDSKCPSEAPGRVVRLCAVVIHENLAIAAIAEEGSAERS